MWTASQTALWSGRDDSRESDKAKRVFQTISVADTWQTELSRNKIALLGFASDAGVARNLVHNCIRHTVPSRQAIKAA